MNADKKYPFTVCIARSENSVHYYEVEATSSAEAKRLAYEEHESENMAPGRVVHAEEWTQDIRCDDPEYDGGDEDEEEDEEEDA